MLAQLAEREAFNLTVAGSSPARGENRHSSAVERVALNHSVEGSIPSDGVQKIKIHMLLWRSG